MNEYREELVTFPLSSKAPVAPEISYQRTSAPAPPNTVCCVHTATGAPTTILQSTGRNLDFSCSSTCRWGDYAGASPDPIAGATGGRVWFVNQWNVASVTANDVDWRTQVFNVGF